eukprot:TRINITY_DN7268_c0_g1_i1.p1 TRINITY_DN7268_c0_g1~~TRINITY_DN7268_c0_g1_i1.p1  ORF type:complete len:139 (+),score=8.24 TRINITY_DN7268_c0_g1_i1:135-551(+)
MALDRRGEQLREAACAGDWEAVTSLLHAGVNPNDQNKVNGWTAMHWAAKRGHAKTLQILLANGGDLKVSHLYLHKYLVTMKWSSCRWKTLKAIRLLTWQSRPVQAYSRQQESAYVALSLQRSMSCPPRGLPHRHSVVP